LKWFLRRSVCMYFPQDLLFNCDKYDELRKTLFFKIFTKHRIYRNLLLFSMNSYTHWNITILSSIDKSSLPWRKSSTKFILTIMSEWVWDSLLYCLVLYHMYVEETNFVAFSCLQSVFISFLKLFKFTFGQSNDLILWKSVFLNSSYLSQLNKRSWGKYIQTLFLRNQLTIMSEWVYCLVLYYMYVEETNFVAFRLFAILLK
jgi:hypothetical protein